MKGQGHRQHILKRTFQA